MSVNGSLEPVQTLNGKAAASPYIPQRMVNKLKLTGAVEAEYDGSTEVEVEVPAESDPTVPAWAKADSAPVTSVNGKKGAVYLSASDVGALSSGTYVPTQTYINQQIETKLQSYARRSEIPKKLPNPNRLTFTGAVNAVYDGTTPVSVKIPTGGSGGGGDWNQNDPSGAGYIKNRTHWVETEMISEDFNAWNERTLLGFPMFDVGDTVTVYVDGVEYSLKAYEEYNDYGRSITIGDTGNELGAGGGKYGWKLYAMDGTVFFVANKACTVSYPGETIHRLDAKYMPKMNPIEDVDNEGVLMYRFNDLLQALRNAGYLATEYDSGLV